MRITAEMGRGGVRLEVDTTLVLRIEENCGEIVFDLPEVLSPGYQELDFELYGSHRIANPCVRFEFDSPGKVGFSGYFIPVDEGIFHYRCLIYNLFPVSRLTLSIDSRRPMAAMGIAALTIRPQTFSPGLPVFFECRVENGLISFPPDLPYGVYQFQLPKPCPIHWECADGNFDTPEISENIVRVAAGNFISARLVSCQPKICNKTAADTTLGISFSGIIHAEHYLDRVALENPFQLPDCAVDFSRTIESTGIVDPSAIPVYPFGKHFALVTSWDDGMAQDQLLTDVLKQYGVAGTLGMNRFSPVIDQILELEAKGFEIASHSATHPFLWLATPDRCRREAIVMRHLLEEKLGHPVISMIYPFDFRPSFDVHGEYVGRTLVENGFLSSRATTPDRTKSIHNLESLIPLYPDFHFITPVEQLQSRLHAARTAPPGDLIYLWGHSYELSHDGLQHLHDTLNVFAGQSDIWYATQGDFALWFLFKKYAKFTSASHLTLPYLHPWLLERLKNLFRDTPLSSLTFS